MPTPTSYVYTKTPVNLDTLGNEIRASAIATAYDHASMLGVEITLYFKDALSSGDVTLLNGVVAAHTGAASPQLYDAKVLLTDGLGNDANQLDTDGAQIVRIKAAKKGWTYNAVPIEFRTAEIGSIYSKTADGVDRPGITMKFFNAQNQEITSEGLLEINEGTIIKTVIDYEPSFDYEIIGGELRIEQDITTAQDCRLWIIAVPDVPAAYGGSKEMAGGVNLRFLSPQNTLMVDGRVAKYLAYNPALHTNKLRFMFQHTAGLKVWIHLTLDLYRP